MITKKDTSFLIVGLGVIGGSYAMGLTQKGYTVTGIDTDTKSLNYALEKGYIKSGSTTADKEIISQADVIIFALYPKIFLDWVSKNKDYFKKGAVITDVTGVKSPLVYDIQKILPQDVEFVPAHPMAGKESSGIKNSDPQIFKGANYIVTPTNTNTKEAIDLCKGIGEALDFEKISVITPEFHDEMIGFVSQLTHCIAVSLMTCYESVGLEDYTGDSFRDLTRIAKINDEMWSELFIANKQALLSQMDLFENSFTKLKNSIINNDVDALREQMQISTARRHLFDKPKNRR